MMWHKFTENVKISMYAFEIYFWNAGLLWLNPILLDIPEQFETERLILRAPQLGDGIMINQAIRESFKTLSEWLNWADHIPEIEETEANVRKNRANFYLRQGFFFCILDKISGRFMGTCSLLRIDWNVRRFEIGYWLRESASKYGYMTEAVNGITKYAIHHLNANRIEIRCDTKNIASRRIAERCGYHLEAILIKNHINPAGELADDCIFTKVRLEGGLYGYPIVE